MSGVIYAWFPSCLKNNTPCWPRKKNRKKKLARIKNQTNNATKKALKNSKRAIVDIKKASNALPSPSSISASNSPSYKTSLQNRINVIQQALNTLRKELDIIDSANQAFNAASSQMR
jgi:hypothetical protein